MSTQVKLTFALAVALSVVASFVLEFRETAGVALVFGSIMLWERARNLMWIDDIEEKAREYEAQQEKERQVNMYQQLEEREPGRGRRQNN